MTKRTVQPISPTAKAEPEAVPHAPVTLSVDIGGTGIKMMLLDAAGKPLSERMRALTPPEPTPAVVLAVLDELKSQIPESAPKFDRVSVGFPGVVKSGMTLEAHNLHPKWAGFPLQQTLIDEWHKPVRVANDASVQGYGAIYGKGVELCLTVGTGLGSSLFTDGRLCPGLELAHHPWRKDKTYEDYLGLRGLEKYGKKRWNRLVEKAIAQTAQLFNWDFLHIGGGNAKHIKFELTHNVRIVPNEEGLLGGVALWRNG
jgi:polyphosphate glucokinase